MNQQYLEAVLTELGNVPTSSNTPKVALSSIYFGGGTPSLAPVATIANILDAIHKSPDSPFHLSEDAEVTIEMDPGTFTTDKLRALKDMGINRISLGVQSFDDHLLETIGRVHRRRDIDDALRSLQEVFGDDVNYSLDLISGLPGLSVTTWEETLSIATGDLMPKPSHISVYDLQIERGTVFGNWFKDAEIDADVDKVVSQSTASTGATTTPVLPSEDDCATMYKYASKYLRSQGYEHYEVSSYAAKPELRSHHNQIYWNPEGQWYAFGLGSTSNVNQRTVARPNKMADYLTWVKDQQPGDAMTTRRIDPIGKESIIDADLDSDETTSSQDSDDEYLTDVIMKRLRTSDGLDLDWVRRRFGEQIKQQVLDGAQLGFDLGFAEVISTPGGGKDGTSPAEVLRLVDPDGFLCSNYIISNIFVELDMVED